MTKRRVALTVAIAMIAAALGLLIAKRNEPSPPQLAQPVETKPVTNSSPVAEPPPAAQKSAVMAVEKQTSIARVIPLVKRQDALRDRARDGDAAAASELFSDTWKCTNAKQVAEATLRSSDQSLPPEVDPLENLQSALRQVRDTEALCAGIGDIDDGRLYAQSLRAAQLGDLTAACFYLNAPLLVDDGRIGNTVSDVIVVGAPAPVDHRDPDLIESYQENFAQVAEWSITHGDWNAVSQLQSIYGNGVQIVYVPIAKDEALAYRYYRLWVLGTADDELRRRRLRQADADLPSTLTPQQIDDARSWAQTTFDRYFTRRIDDRNEHFICAIPPLQGLP